MILFIKSNVLREQLASIYFMIMLKLLFTRLVGLILCWSLVLERTFLSYRGRVVLESSSITENSSLRILVSFVIDNSTDCSLSFLPLILFSIFSSKYCEFYMALTSFARISALVFLKKAVQMEYWMSDYVAAYELKEFLIGRSSGC